MDELRKISSEVNQLPDLKQLVETLTAIFECIGTDDMIRLRETDKDKYDETLLKKFPDFCERYWSLFNIILDGEMESMGNLVMMINTICMVKTGQISMDTAYAHIREKLSEKYIYPTFGGKDKFEKTMIENHRKKK